MVKKITSSQLIGEIGEAAARLRFLHMGFQFDGRSRLEAGIDGIAELMNEGHPVAKMIAVQVKATKSSRYANETDTGFSYLLKSDDLEYWRGSNLPVIIVLYRQSDDTFYWKEVAAVSAVEERRIRFDKFHDILDSKAKDRLAALTVSKAGFGYYVPPLGNGEEALVNVLPVNLPLEIFVATSEHTGKQATAILLDDNEAAARFDWVIRGGTFWSFHDPRTSSCRSIIDEGSVEAIETSYLAFHDDIDERNNFSFLLKNSLRHQTERDLGWNKDKRLLYFRAIEANASRTFRYESSKNKAQAEVVNVTLNKKDASQVSFVRHHAFEPRFEIIGDQWFLVVTPSYVFTTDGFSPHPHPQALLAGKKRLDNSAALRGQVIMWHRFLTQSQKDETGLFSSEPAEAPILTFDTPPVVQLTTRVPEDVWGGAKKKPDSEIGQGRLAV